jgi:serine/threonine protein kinase
LIDKDGVLQVVDFGLAKKRSEVFPDACPLQPKSTHNCAPEQLSSEYGELGFRCDIYSLGTVLYEMLTGRRVYGGDMAQVLDQLRFDPPRRITDYDQSIPLELEELCLRAIKKQPSERFSSVEEFRDRLQLFALKSGIEVGRSVVLV